MKTADLFQTELPAVLQPLLAVAWPWEVLAQLDSFVAQIKDERLGQVHPTAVLDGNIYLAKGATVGPHAYIEGPAWLGDGVTVKHGAYLRAGVVLAPGASAGAKTEVKHSLFLPGATAAHLNYVGDSVLGAGVNLGAGVKLANFKTDGSNITVDGQATGLRKLGGLLGDGVSIGCNAVTVPGTVIGPNSAVYNCVMVRGTVPANSIVKLRQTQEIIQKH